MFDYQRVYIYIIIYIYNNIYIYMYKKYKIYYTYIIWVVKCLEFFFFGAPGMNFWIGPVHSTRMPRETDEFSLKTCSDESNASCNDQKTEKTKNKRKNEKKEFYGNLKIQRLPSLFFLNHSYWVHGPCTEITQNGPLGIMIQFQAGPWA